VTSGQDQINQCLVGLFGFLLVIEEEVLRSRRLLQSRILLKRSCSRSNGGDRREVRQTLKRHKHTLALRKRRSGLQQSIHSRVLQPLFPYQEYKVKFTMLDLLEKPDTQETDSDSSEHFAHYAEAAKVTEGYIMGTPVIALCGKIFIPHRNPEKLRVCQNCKEILDGLFLDSE
jgi:hypothetical protein